MTRDSFFSEQQKKNLYEHHSNENTIQVKPFKQEKNKLHHKITWNSCISDLDYAAYKKVHSTGTSIMEQNDSRGK